MSKLLLLKLNEQEDLLFRYSKLFIKSPKNFAIFCLACVVRSKGKVTYLAVCDSRGSHQIKEMPNFIQ